MSTERANKHNFKASIGLEEGIKTTIDWYLENNQNLDKLKYNSFK